MCLVVYPQLHEREFLARTMFMPTAQLAAQLGCWPATVETCRRDHGLLHRAAWNRVHLGLLSQFYGRFRVAFIAEGLRRTERAVYACAHRLGLKGGRGHGASGEARSRFRPAWRRAICRNWIRWEAAGLTDHALGVLWRSPAAFVPCEDCAHRSECQPKACGTLPCERLTVGEYLQYCHTRETGCCASQDTGCLDRSSTVSRSYWRAR
jgi:hypothetical protein